MQPHVVATPMLPQDYGTASPADFIGFAAGPAWWVPAPRALLRWHQMAGFAAPRLVNGFEVVRVRGDRQGDHVGIVHARA
jgi:hypothetical protein